MLHTDVAICNSPPAPAHPMMNAPASISASLLPVNTTISVTRQMTGYTTINLTSLIFLVKSAVTTSAIIVPAE